MDQELHPAYMEVTALIGLARSIENKVGEIYLLFSKKVPEDKQFWEQMYQEEVGHATMITAWNIVAPRGAPLPLPMHATAKEMYAAKKDLENKLRGYSQQPISREGALQAGLDIELMANEVHMQKMLKTHVDDSTGLLAILQELHEQDKNHARRIIEYAHSKHIQLTTKES